MEWSRVSIFYAGVCVGRVTCVLSDMWHMRGRWVRSGAALVDEFESLVGLLDFESVIQDYRQGVVVRCSDSVSGVYMAVVTGLDSGVLSFMRCSTGDALGWTWRVYEANRERCYECVRGSWQL